MAIVVLAPGKSKEEWIEQGINRYLRLLKNFTSVELRILPDYSRSPGTKPEDVKLKEAAIIGKAIPPGYFVVALDERGKQFKSVDFAPTLGLHAHFCFIIGGVYGLHPSIVKKADLVLGLSKFTFTHRMARVLLLEQLYRCYTILKNRPYHY